MLLQSGILGAKSVLGVDIDKSLIRKAYTERGRLKNKKAAEAFLKEVLKSMNTKQSLMASKKTQKSPTSQSSFATTASATSSSPSSKSSLSLPGNPSPNFDIAVPNNFPENVHFRAENVLAGTALHSASSHSYHNNPPDEVKTYDTILCFSITKWIHLNWGDEGILDLFHAIYKSLNEKGRLILEPQPWTSYHKKKKITPHTLETYKSIEIRPQDFACILVTVIGFRDVDVLYSPTSEVFMQSENDRSPMSPMSAGKKRSRPNGAAGGGGFDRTLWCCTK